MKDDDWVDAIRPKRTKVCFTLFTDSIYEEMSDESLNEMRDKVNEEYRRRQKMYFDNILEGLTLRKDIQGE